MNQSTSQVSGEEDTAAMKQEAQPDLQIQSNGTDEHARTETQAHNVFESEEKTTDQRSQQNQQLRQDQQNQQSQDQQQQQSQDQQNCRWLRLIQLMLNSVHWQI